LRKLRRGDEVLEVAHLEIIEVPTLKRRPNRSDLPEPAVTTPELAFIVYYRKRCYRHGV
jgi:hypothetical protein